MEDDVPVANGVALVLDEAEHGGGLNAVHAQVGEALLDRRRAAEAGVGVVVLAEAEGQAVVGLEA